MSNVLCAVLLATMTMRDAIGRAVANSPDVRALEAQLIEARANAHLTDAFRPMATLSTTPGYATGLPIAVLGQVPAIATIEAHKLLYDTSAQTELLSAEAQIDEMEARLETRKREVAQSAADLFARATAGSMIATNAQRRVEAYRTIASHAAALRSEGRARDLDVNRAALQLASARRAALLAQSRVELDQLRLERMTGGSQPAVELKPFSPTATLDSQIEKLQRALASEKRLFKPSIAAQVQYARLFGRYGRFYLNFKPDDFSAAASVSLPIWTSGRRTATIERISAQLQQVTAMRDARRDEIELNVREAQADSKQAEAERELAQRTLTVAQEGLRVAQDLAREGRGEVNDVPLAQIAVADAEDDLANAEAHASAARAKLQIVRGDPI